MSNRSKIVSRGMTEQEQIQYLIYILKHNKITVDELLIECDEKRAEFSAQVLQTIGTLYLKGEDGFPKDLPKAFQLFQFAASMGCEQKSFSKEMPNIVAHADRLLLELQSFTGQDPLKEQSMAELMQHYCEHSKPITKAQLRAIHPETSEDHVQSINQIFYTYFIKNNPSWVNFGEPRAQLSSSRAQSKALWLIQKGHLALYDVFAEQGACSIFTGRSPAELPVKVARIDALYQKNILENKSDRPLQFSSHSRFRSTAMPKPEAVTTDQTPGIRFEKKIKGLIDSSTRRKYEIN